MELCGECMLDLCIVAIQNTKLVAIYPTYAALLLCLPPYLFTCHILITNTAALMRGFDRNVPQMSPVFPLRQCLQRAVMNKLKQLSINNQRIRVPRLRAFNFAQVPLRCMLRMQSNSVVKTEF